MDDDIHNDGSGRNNDQTPDSPCLNNKDNSGNDYRGGGGRNTKEQDRFLPIANVGRIMKKVIPSAGKISKDAKETVQECVSEFISFVTGEASDRCQREKRKTINGDDVIWAITTLGFEDYVNPLKIYLQKYRELEGEKLNVPKQQRPSDQQQQQHRLHQLDHQHQDQTVGLAPYTNQLYSTTGLMAPPHHGSFVGQEPPLFNLPFSQSNSLQKAYQHPEQIDSIGHW